MFQSQLVLVDYQPDEWVLARPLVWRDGDTVIEVPLRFITDLASTPRFLRVLPEFDVNGLSRRPAVLHDALYSGAIQSCAGMSRKDADDLLRRALLSVGVSADVARMYWLGVRVGGSIYWNKRLREGRPSQDDFVPESFFTSA